MLYKGYVGFCKIFGALASGFLVFFFFVVSGHGTEFWDLRLELSTALQN